jgi:uncharacterized protein (TIGR04141 family)
MPRIDTLADILTAARVRTGHDMLGMVSAGRSLQFPAIISSVDRFRELSELVAGLATRVDYRESNGWIDDTVPEDDELVIQEVFDHIWKGVDDQGRPVAVDIAWWEDVREDESDHPVTHWRLAHERRERRPSRRVTLTWPAVRSAIEYRGGQEWQGHQALATDMRFFSHDEQELGRCAAAELLSAELSLGGITYVLVDGQVCRVDMDFLAALDRELAQHLVASRLAPYWPGELEAHYSKRTAATSAHRFPVTFAIIGVWQNPTIKNLSLLSRMALRTGMQRLSDLGYRTDLMLIGQAGQLATLPNSAGRSPRPSTPAFADQPPYAGIPAPAQP